MIKSISEKTMSMYEIDLTGPEGNVFCLMGRILELEKDMGATKDEANDVITKLKCDPDGYEAFVNYIEDNYGHIVTMYR